jgi:hypothetical protein
MYSKAPYNPTYRQEFADYLAEWRIRFKPKRLSRRRRRLVTE